MTDRSQSSRGVPEVISHYRLGNVLGSGGMGTVYRATDRRDRSEVAVKLLHPHLAEDETFRQRFEQEAYVGALLRAPYTVHLLDYGFAEDHYFIVMEYVEGETLKEALRGGPLNVGRALPIAARVAKALAEAEARGVVHRDIKPENILLGPGETVKVSDFGIARQAGSGTLTMPGGFIGSLAYAAPEQALGAADHRSDIYSLGATLYHTLTGRPPFSGDVLEMLRHHRETPLPLEPLGGLPAAVTEVVRRCLEKDPGRRYQSASVLAAALEHALRPEEPSTSVAAVETPGAAAIEATKPIEATEPAATAALGTAVTLELGPPKASGRLGPRLGPTSYDLVLRNESDEAIEVRLAAEDSEGRCSFSLPDRVSVPARGATTANLKIRPRKRRWRGGPETCLFIVSADAGGGAPPVTVSGQFDDMPYGWMPYGGGIFAAAGAAVVLVLLVPLGGGGGSTPSTTGPSPTAGANELIAQPSSPTAPGPTATPEIIYRSPSGYPVDPTTATLIVDGSIGSRRLVEGGPSVQVYSERQQVGSDPGRANAAGWNCRTHQEYIGQPAVDWYLPKETRVLSTLDGTATLYVNTVVNTFDYYGVPAEPYLGNPDRSRASLNPFPGPNGGKGVWVEVASDSFLARYVHLDAALTAQVVPPGVFLAGYSASFDFESSFATPRPFTEGTPIASWKVRRGDVIGSTDDSGHAEGPQLHYDVARVGDSSRLCPTDESDFAVNGWLRNQDPDRLATSPTDGAGSEEPPPEEPPPEEPAPAAQRPIEYTVQEGDTLFGIAEFFAVSFEDILAFNGLSEEDVPFIQPGDVLAIPQE